MPACYCEFARCDGAKVSVAAFNRHKREDKITLFQSAVNLTEQIARHQEDTINAHLASGGRLGDNLPNQDVRPRDRPPRLETYQHMVHSRLHHLSIIEKEVGTLSDSVELGLLTLGAPKSREDVFPLSESSAAARDISSKLSSIAGRSPEVQEAKKSVSEQLFALMHKLREAKTCWKEMQSKLPATPRLRTPSTVYDTNSRSAPILPNSDPIIQVTIFTMAVLQVTLHLSRRGCRFLLGMIGLIVQLALLRNGSSLSVQDQKLLSDFPKDPETAVKHFLRNSKEVIYAVCPKFSCQKLYAPSFYASSPVPLYPAYCSHCKVKNGDSCGTRLTRPRFFGDVKVEVPIKRFIGFSFKDYIASLTSRVGFEEYMDQASAFDARDQTPMRDFFNGKFFRDFLGPDGKPFRSTSGPEGRYCFSLGFDFFNPLSNKQSGKKVSCGVISLVCLNLPIHLRYKPENMFLAGIIPGPKEPPLDASNHYLTPIVDELVEFWKPGVRFSQTVKCPEGRLIMCALILVICDLPAARKISGFASYNSEHFCNVCCCRLSKPGLQNTDFFHWEIRTDEEYRNAMEEYDTALTDESKEEKFRKNGIRCSELRRLTYFDMVNSVVVDPAHNHFLGLINEHFTNILGLRVKPFREGPTIEIKFSDATQNLPNNTMKGIERREAQNETREPGATTSTLCGHVLQPNEMEAIHMDLQQLLTPSWMTSVPLNLGQASHGKLKADQWRALGTTHLAIALIRLWSLTTANDERSRKCYEVMKVTLSLISAIILATSHEVSTANADAYLDHMLDYLNGIKRLFPGYKLKPNHHMALHIHRYLILFGPVHTWWAFPFERLVGSLQRIPNNGKVGDMEDTMAYGYARMSNLQTLLSTSGCPEIIQNSRPLFEALFCSQLRDRVQTIVRPEMLSNRKAEVAGGTQRSLPPDLRFAFTRSNIEPPLRALLPSTIVISGLIYTTSNKHSGNSCAMITYGDSPEPIPAQVVYIVRFRSSAGPLLTYLAIRCHKTAFVTRDPYLCFPALKAQLWSACLSDLELVSPSQVVCHYACLPLNFEGQELVVAMSLSRTIILYCDEEENVNSDE
ncbi:hypothetical protein CVT26_010514 [Gymnopilus dilepis]|uniref:DUF4218 domain-containing protein n=1 Tax=Gymnopilus dilepis TaxID=231916 RepID=A0A409Y0B9_9AGAR|nr:hypothetical protein CVT26_010514 [Gymnopilus dilepis]